jgi:diketogulonate reductase-like aldo/keto reductase
MGLWKVHDDSSFYQIFKTAIDSGYRLFDSAQVYNNEHLLGDSWKKSGVDRKDIFITTKISISNFGHKKTLKSFEESLNKLQTDYVDLLLLHFPGFPWLRKGSWKALEEIKASGGAKSIGVSNYRVKHLEKMKKYAREIPAVDQVEMHVFLQQRELYEYCKNSSITIEAYSPIAHAQAMSEPVIQEIAKKHNKTYAQIMIRWCIEKGVVPIPKSSNNQRIAENIDVFDFKLDNNDLNRIDKLDKNLRTVYRSIASSK